VPALAFAAPFRYKHLTMTDRPRLRAFLWVSAVLLGGLGLVVLAYTLIAGENIFYAFAAFVIALLAVAYMILVLLRLGRSKQGTRWYDRERRGF
jgi:peptidoglycan/LPS O-acetylase OafA/YrhL